MASRRQFRHEDVAQAPQGWRVRTIKRGGHEVRIAFPPGRRKKGSGKLVSVLHPQGENPSCSLAGKIAANPGLWIHKAIEHPGRLRAALHKKEGEKITAAELRAVIAHPEKYDKRDPVGIERAAILAAGLRSYHHNRKKRGKRNVARRGKKRGKHNPGELLIFGNPGSKFPELRRYWKSYFESLGLTPRQVKLAMELHRKGSIPEVAARLAKERTNPRRKPNQDAPLEVGVQLYQAFHGKDPKSVREIQESAEIRRDYVALGKLVTLYIRPQEQKDLAKLDFDGDGVTLASNTEGSQLYFIGGRQKLDGCARAFPKADWSKDFVYLGHAVQVEYAARKSMDNFEPVTYYHKLGEETGVLPVAAYDTLNERILLVGGAYKVEAPGIVN